MGEAQRRLGLGSWYGASMLPPEIDTLLKPGRMVCVLGASEALRSRWYGTCSEREGAAVVSPRAQQELYERVLRDDDTDYSDRLDPGPTVEDLLSGCPPRAVVPKVSSSCRSCGAGDERAAPRADGKGAPGEVQRVAAMLGLTEVWQRGYRLLSTGEARKLLLAQVLLSRPTEVTLESPFEGLDTGSRRAVGTVLRELVSRRARVLIFAHLVEDVPEGCAQLVVLEHDCVDAVIEQPEASHLVDLGQLRAMRARESLQLPWQARSKTLELEKLLRMRNVSVRYSNVVQFEGLDWEVRAGEHTAIVGPNGSGKSTLMQLISGDHPQCYSNDIRVLGYQRGTGESIWDVKGRLGLVSAALHRDYRVACSAKMAVVSGLFDSIGVYGSVTQDQCRLAERWLEAFHMAELADRSFPALSYAQQRLLLIARALIKQPPLLILDEPTIGLSSLGRALLKEVLHRLTASSTTTLLLVTHREEERAGFPRVLRFLPSDVSGVRFRIVPERPR